MYSVGGILASLLTGLMTLCTPYVAMLLISAFLLTSSNLLFSLASHGWMIALSRLLFGIAFRFTRVPTLTYVSIKEADYVEAYMEHKSKKKEKDHDSDDDTLENEKEESGPSIQIKKTILVLVTISNYLPAVFGPGKYMLIVRHILNYFFL